MLVIHAEDDALPMSKASLFLVGLEIRQKIFLVTFSRKLRQKTLVTRLGDHVVSVSPHQTLNTVRGVITFSTVQRRKFSRDSATMQSLASDALLLGQTDESSPENV